ncbi:MAG: helix-turn-helix transcriptional regulator [Microbacteriaceae bacterium]
MVLQGEIDSAEALGGILQQGRLLSGMTQRELAKRLGMSQRYIWEIESGKPSVLMSRLFAVMRETGVRLFAELDDERDSVDG